jgi:hypothetical protein
MEQLRYQPGKSSGRPAIQPTARLLLTAKEAADRIGICRLNMFKLIRQGLERQRDDSAFIRPGRAWTAERWVSHWLVELEPAARLSPIFRQLGGPRDGQPA